MNPPADIRSRMLMKKFATPMNTLGKKTGIKPPSAIGIKGSLAKGSVAKPAAFVCSPEYKKVVAEHAHLGKKGYTIPKSVLSPDDQAFLKLDLFMRPVVAGGVSYGGDAAQDVAFPVYRENENKLYIPRFYGEERYGLPTKCDIDDGVNIDVPFAKPLRDYQDNIVDIYVRHVSKRITLDESDTRCGGGAILEVPCGRGKCLAKDTMVLMYNGMVQRVQDIGCGEFVMGDDSTPRRVISLARGRERMVRIRETMDVGEYTGESYVVNRSHILSLHRRGRENHVFDISVEDFMALSPETRAEYSGFRVSLQFPRMYPDPVEIEPYDMGVWLTSPITNTFEHLHMKSYRMWATDAAGAVCKRMPEQYKCGSWEIRSEMMRGICTELERDGVLVIPEPRLFADVVFVARSLGYRVIVKDATSMTLDKSPTTLEYTFEIEELEEDEYYGFELTGNHRFVLGDMTVTHNTVMALKIISVLQKKTLILVHKEFLMNQWIERIAEFLPTATVGKIQGQVFDVAGRDIVIGMIQSLYDKDYGANAFAEFGLTVIDEVHRIGSEQFSKTLLKILTRYMLGISATVERKDGMTKVLNMFIGPKIYSEEREQTDPVCVRAVEYVSADPEFNEVEYDFRGKPKHSTMLSKLSNYVPRSEFIVRIIADLVKEHPENQIMILGHQRALLTYFYEAIRGLGIAGGSVGYYIGGMKEESLKTTETMRIVLATYAMAAEALDIKSLATLVMVSPKTDIVQSVGRILRVQHEHPIIVDVVDKHDLFQNQWAQRRRYYKKCGYRVRQIDSLRYSGMSLDWKTDRSWRWVHEPVNLPGEKETGDDSGDEVAMPRKCLLDTSSIDFDALEY